MAEAANEEAVACDLGDFGAVQKLAQGVDAIVHFGGYPREAGWETIVPANIVTMANVFEAAQRAGVRRMVYASTGFHPSDARIVLNAGVRAESRHGVSKALAETVARFYFEKYGLESLGIRIERVERMGIPHITTVAALTVR